MLSRLRKKYKVGISKFGCIKKIHIIFAFYMKILVCLY